MCHLGGRADKGGRETEIAGNDTLIGQVATFIESLHLSYREVVYLIPYRNLVLMCSDKLRLVYGNSSQEKVKNVSGKEMLGRKRAGW